MTYGQLPEGFKQLTDRQVQNILDKYRRDDERIPVLIGDYLRLRNIEKLNVGQYDRSLSLIGETLKSSRHLPLLHGRVIVACENILDLRQDIKDLKKFRKVHRKKALLYYIELQRLRKEREELYQAIFWLATCSLLTGIALSFASLAPS